MSRQKRYVGYHQRRKISGQGTRKRGFKVSQPMSNICKKERAALKDIRTKMKRLPSYQQIKEVPL